MKKIILSFVALFSAMVCFSQSCTIIGRMNVPDFQNKEVAILNAATFDVLATTKIVDSAFTFDISVDEPFWGWIKTETLSGNNYYFLDVVVEPGTVTCDLVTDDLAGTSTNDRYFKFNKEMNHEKEIWYAYAEKFQNISQMSENEVKSLTDEFQLQINKMVDLAQSVFLANKDNLVATKAFDFLAEMVGAKSFDYSELSAMLADAAPIVRNYPKVVKKMEQFDKLYQTVAGKPYIDLDLKDFKTKKPVKLSKYIKGKIALIDFWASWCRPCRAEIPNIAQIYEKYGKDVVVISLNVWDQPTAQAKAIKDLKMNWLQLTDDTKNATNVYGIEGIPHIMLIGKDGTILARDLRGEEIEAAVKKALGK
ncbi:MAG: AhpC/TSA family protein [Bacteroidales bacterium]|nr:AhpC/TSA family protein [Bacteroidales bacterium]